MGKNQWLMSKAKLCCAPKRPEYCAYEVNMCCVVCMRHDNCSQFRPTKQMRPCDLQDFETDEVCGYALFSSDDTKEIA